MAAITGSAINNANANGYSIADGFLGAPSTTDVNNQRLSTQPALTPNGITSAGLITANAGLTTSGPFVNTVTTVAAAGATQGTATAIPATALVVNVTVTASTEGVKLPAITAGLELTLLTPTTKGYKVYAGVAGQVINAATTATTAYAVTTLKPVTFYAVDATHWRAVKGG